MNRNPPTGAGGLFPNSQWTLILLAILTGGLSTPAAIQSQDFQTLTYGQPELAVDLGVGLWAWPLPMDFDADGDLDLVVACPDVPFSGTWLFENPGGESKMPVFLPPVRIGDALKNVCVSYVAGGPRVLTPGKEHPHFLAGETAKTRNLGPAAAFHEGKIRANQWKLADLDGDGDQDLIVGIGYWSDYGWDNAFDERGEWTNGPLHGYVYLLENSGNDEAPQYAEPRKIEAGGAAVDVYGMPSPNLADFDGDGDLDLLCGEFLDGFTYFANQGSRTQPDFAAGVRLTSGGKPLVMDLQMIVPVAVDWDRDGDVDLIVGDEGGRVGFIEHSGQVSEGVPQFLPPRYFQQQARDVKFGALVTPFSVDWDDDGDEDLICGNTAGYVGFIENLDGGDPPKWAPPRRLEAGGKTIRIQAGKSGSIQGPCEAKWGYTTLSVADWDGDGRRDLVANSIWGKVVWFRNAGEQGRPRLEEQRPVRVAWKGEPPRPAWNWWNAGDEELVTQWRTTPLAIDYTGDGVCDLIALDHEGFLALYEGSRQEGETVLAPPRRVFSSVGASEFDGRHAALNKSGGLLRLNAQTAGRSGRRKFCLADWDGDGRLDLLVNSKSVDLMRGVKKTGEAMTFEIAGPLSKQVLAGHTTSPTAVDWDQNGIPDLLVGAEDGRLYYLKNPRGR